MSSKALAPNTSCVLYLGAIPYHWDVEIIKSVVCGSGPVVDVRCMMDNVAKNKGFCFIEYATPQDAQRALRLLSMVKLEGRKKLRIELSKEGLRNPTPGSKPELKLNRNFLPSGVTLPSEMLAYDSPNAKVGESPLQLQSHNDLLATLSMNPQLQQTVSQMISNGMDMNQISLLIQQFNQQQGNPSTNSSTSSPPQQPQSSQPNLNMFDSSAANRNPNNQTNANNHLNSLKHLSVSASYLPSPQDLNIPVLTRDNVSETLSTIPPGKLIELLSQLKLILSNSNSSSNQLDAVNLLNANPQLAVAAAQSLLLMGIIDLDVISQTMHNTNNSNQNSTVNNTLQPLNNSNSQMQQQYSLQPNGTPQSQGQQSFNLHHQPTFDTALSNSQYPNSLRAPVAVPQSQQQLPPPQQDQQPINPNWIGLSPMTIQKLSTISENEANLIVQVLKLTSQQIDSLPENDRLMANQIRAQYL